MVEQNLYNPTMNNIYSLLDSLENKLGRYSNYSSYGVESNNNYNNLVKKGPDFNNNIDYDYIKKIISDEFGQLIQPYQRNLNMNVNSLETKINSMNSAIEYIKDINQNNNSKIINNQNETKDNYVTRKEYIELQNQISLMDSSIISLKKLIDKNYDNDNNIRIFSSKNNEIQMNDKSIMQEINNIKKSISQNINIYNMKPNEQLKEYDLKMNNIIQQYNAVKEENKNLIGELSQIKEQMINETQKNLNETSINELNLNEMKKLNNKIKNLENNLKGIEQNCSLKLMNFKNNINDFELKLNELKIKKSDNEVLNINNNNILLPTSNKNDKTIEEIINKKFEEFNFDNNKHFQELNLKYDSKNEQIFKLFEEHNIIINNLNLKIEKIKNNIELDNKKKFNHLTEKIEKSMIQLGESNNVFNNESRIDTNILIGTDNINNIKLLINKQDIKLDNIQKEIKQELNKIYKEFTNYNKRIYSIEKKATDEKIFDNKNKENNIKLEDKSNKSDEKENNISIKNNQNNAAKENLSKKSSKNSKKNSGPGDNFSVESLLI